MEVIFNVIAIKNNIGYASDLEKNGLFEVNIETGECRFIKIFPNEEVIINHLHGCAEWIGNKVFFIPSAGENISVYHTDTKEIETVKIPQVPKNNNYNPKLKFTKVISYNGFLWLIPATYPGILKFNPDKNEIMVMDDWIPDDGYMFRRAICARGNTVYAASGNNNNVLIFDMDSGNGEVVKVGKANNGMMDICECGEDFIMAPRKYGAVIKWNPISNMTEEYNEYPEEFEPGEIVFQYIYECESQFILAPAYASHGIRLSDNRLIIENYILWKTDRNTKVEFMFETDTQIYFREFSANLPNRFYFVDKKNNDLAFCQFHVINPDERKNEIAKAVVANCEIVKESSSFGLKDWIKGIV